MTLILITSVKGELHVLADTEFGQGRATGSQVGPKVFLVPMQAIDLDGNDKRIFPNMGFAYAGNVLSGQFTHALASGCLQNLVGATTSTEVQVGEVADIYAKAAEQIALERWKHLKSSKYGFDCVVFGRPSSGSTSAFHINIGVDDNGAHTHVEPINFDETNVQAIGSGAPAARAYISRNLQAGIPLRPIEIMDHVINEPEVPSVSGTVQLAVTTKAGVEIRPIFRYTSDRAGEFTLLGVNVLHLGMVGQYVPIGTPNSVDIPFESLLDFEVRD